MQFEYKLVTHKTKGLLGGKVDIDTMSDEYNIYGQDGWELVSIMNTQEYGGGSKQMVAVFKRCIK